MYCPSIDKLKPIFAAEYERAKVLLQNSPYGIDIEVTKHKRNRSNAANNYYWLFNSQLSDFLNDAGLTYGEYSIPYTSEIVHDINKKLFGVKTTTKMSVGEFCEYMNKLLFFWQEKTAGEFQMSELPANYLERKGYQIYD